MRPIPTFDKPLLSVRNLRTSFFQDEGTTKAVDGASFDVEPRKTLAIVGESGCGKSVTALSLMRLVYDPGRIVGGSVKLDGRDLIGLDEATMRAIRGNHISMIFQEPMVITGLSEVIGSWKIMEM